MLVAPVALGQAVRYRAERGLRTGIVMASEDFRYQRHYGIAATENMLFAGVLRDYDYLDWVTPDQLRLQPWALARDPSTVRLHSHRVIDDAGIFYAASDKRDCDRLARSIGGRVEINVDPIWYNDAHNPDFDTGRPETAAFRHGHP